MVFYNPKTLGNCAILLLSDIHMFAGEQPSTARRRLLGAASDVERSSQSLSVSHSTAGLTPLVFHCLIGITGRTCVHDS